MALLAVATGLLSASLPASASATAPMASTVQIGSFNRPTYVTATPSSPDLLFVTERGGKIEVMKDEVPLTEPFLDISEIVYAAQEDPGAENEQGLHSVAFAPDYADSGRFYVYFTNTDGDIEIDEFERSADSATRADPESRRVVIVISHRMAKNHNGGQLQFGPHGPLLYFATGDGGAGQRANARDLDSLLGKVLRIDPRARRGQPYRIPGSNPFVGTPGRDEILAYGLRNPYRFSFDGGRIAIGDVGQATSEEVDVIRISDAVGANFGWPEYEGYDLFEPTLPGPDPVTFPVHVYSHEPNACAITGGYVVRDPDLPQLFGRYVYGDFCTGELRSLRPGLSTEDGRAVGDRPVGITAANITTFGKGIGEQIYFATFSGAVYRLEPPAL